MRWCQPTIAAVAALACETALGGGYPPGGNAVSISWQRIYGAPNFGTNGTVNAGQLSGHTLASITNSGGTATNVFGTNVIGAVAEAAHSTNADNSGFLGGLSASFFLNGANLQADTINSNSLDAATRNQLFSLTPSLEASHATNADIAASVPWSGVTGPPEFSTNHTGDAWSIQGLLPSDFAPSNSAGIIAALGFQPQTNNPNIFFQTIALPGGFVLTNLSDGFSPIVTQSGGTLIIETLPAFNPMMSVTTNGLLTIPSLAVLNGIDGSQIQDGTVNSNKLDQPTRDQLFTIASNITVISAQTNVYGSNVIGGVLASTYATNVPWSGVSGAPAFITGNETITFSGDVSGSGTTSASLTVTNIRGRLTNSISGSASNVAWAGITSLPAAGLSTNGSGNAGLFGNQPTNAFTPNSKAGVNAALGFNVPTNGTVAAGTATAAVTAANVPWSGVQSPPSFGTNGTVLAGSVSAANVTGGISITSSNEVLIASNNLVATFYLPFVLPTNFQVLVPGNLTNTLQFSSSGRLTNILDH